MKRAFTFIFAFAFLLGIAPLALAQNKGALVLTRGVYYNDAVIQAFQQDHPKVTLKLNEKMDSYYSVLAECMINRDDSFDIFDPRSNEGIFQMLCEKAYFVDLSENSEIVAYINSLYPVIKKQLLQDDHVLGVPFDFQLRYMFVHNGSIADEIGLSSEEVPKTLPELLEFARRWNDDYADAFPEYYPFYVEDDGLLPNQYLDLVLDMYRYHCIANSGELTYDTPLFLSLLEAVKPFTTAPTAQKSMDEGSVIETPGPRECLFYCFPADMREIFSSEYQGQMPPLPLEEGAIVFQPYEIECAVVNPYGKNTDLAVELAEYVVRHTDPYLKRALSPEITLPYENPTFQEDMQNWANEKSQAEKALQAAKPENKKELESRVEFWDDMIDRQEEFRYAISPQMLESYRTKIAPCLYPIGESIFGREGIRDEVRRRAKEWIDGSLH